MELRCLLWRGWAVCAELREARCALHLAVCRMSILNNADVCCSKSQGSRQKAPAADPRQWGGCVQPSALWLRGTARGMEGGYGERPRSTKSTEIPTGTAGWWSHRRRRCPRNVQLLCYGAWFSGETLDVCGWLEWVMLEDFSNLGDAVRLNTALQFVDRDTKQGGE